MFFSVIVPCYNVQDYIEECITSILNQTFDDYELLLIDDGSTDMTTYICRRYAEIDHRIKYLVKENGGVSSARNLGLQKASGKYIVFVDSDDYLDRNYLCDCKHELCSGVEYLKFGYTRVDQNGVKIDDSHSIDKEIICKSERDYKSLLTDLLCGKTNGWEIWASVFNRKVLINNEIHFYSTCDYAEDLVFTLQYLMCVSKIRLSSNNGYHYRIRKDSIVHSTVESDHIESMIALCKNCIEWASKRKRKVSQENIKFFTLLICLKPYLTIDDEEKQKKLNCVYRNNPFIQKLIRESFLEKEYWQSLFGPIRLYAIKAIYKSIDVRRSVTYLHLGKMMKRTIERLYQLLDRS